MTGNVDYRLTKESEQRQRAAHRENPCTVLIMRWRKRKMLCPLSCGNSDSVHVFRDRNQLVVLSINERYGYAGVEIFDLSNADESEYVNGAFEPRIIGSHFSQSEEELTEIVGRNPFDYTPRTIATRLCGVVA